MAAYLAMRVRCRIGARWGSRSGARACELRERGAEEFAGFYSLVVVWWAHKPLPTVVAKLKRSTLAMYFCRAPRPSSCRFRTSYDTSRHLPSHLRSHPISARLDNFMFQSARAKAKARIGARLCGRGKRLCPLPSPIFLHIPTSTIRQQGSCSFHCPSVRPSYVLTSS